MALQLVAHFEVDLIATYHSSVQGQRCFGMGQYT